MISKHAITKYLEQEADSHTWVKEKGRTWFYNYIDQLPGTNPWLHQLACTYLGVKYPHFGFFLKMALGKSKIIIDILRHRLQKRPRLVTLVLAPYLISMESWRDQLQTHSNGIPFSILTGSSEERFAEVQQAKSAIYVINYQGLSAMLTDTIIKVRKGRKKQKPEWAINKAKLEEFASYFDVLVLDESTAIKNHQTIIYKICLELSRVTQFHYLLTGTPFGKNTHDVWAQYMVMDSGETFGQTLGIFREAFFDTKINYWGGYEYKFRPNMQPEFTRKLEHRTIHYSLDECLDLPQQIESCLYLDWDTEAKVYYDQLKKSFIEMVKSRGNVVQIKNHFMRLRQITSGFLMHKDDDEKTVVRFQTNPKINALLELLQQSDINDKFVVFHFFIQTGEMIAEMLSKEKYKFSRMWSGTKDKEAEYKKFTENPETKVIILNEQVGALGLNLQMANYLTFFDIPVSPITKEQAAARCRRPGQTKTVFCYNFLMKDSVDVKIHDSSIKGKNLLNSILSGEKANL